MMQLPSWTHKTYDQLTWRENAHGNIKIQESQQKKIGKTKIEISGKV